MNIQSTLIGGTFEDETGWWQVDAVSEDGLGVWLIGRDGRERWLPIARLPQLVLASVSEER